MDQLLNDNIINLLKNKPYINQGSNNYATDLNVAEPGFRNWISKYNVPFNPDSTDPSDYDMRGFYHGLMTGNPNAEKSINPNDKKMHYSDYWKTPYHNSFSSESQWATPVAPMWNQKDQLISPGGKILVDERNRYPLFGSYLTGQ